MIEVTGPDWLSTRTLREALATAEGAKPVRWGQSPCNKLEALIRWEQAGIMVPLITDNVAMLQQSQRVRRNPQIWWGRKIHHTKGRDIARDPASRKWVESDFWVRVIPSLHEFRVHVWGGKAFRVGVKELTGTPRTRLQRVEAAQQGDTPIRSARLGWELWYSHKRLTQIIPMKKARNHLRSLATQAVQVLGAVGGAVDILQGTDEQMYVLELNTAPALGEFTLGEYVKRIVEWERE